MQKLNAAWLSNFGLWTLTDDTSAKWAIIKTFFVFHPILIKLGEVVIPMYTTTSPSFIKNYSMEYKPDPIDSLLCLAFPFMKNSKYTK